MKVGGRDFSLTKQEVEARMQGEEPELIRKHMVEVDGRMFPPKQVLGHVTGWERTSFTTLEAQRVLKRIGLVCTEGPGGRVQQAGQFLVDAVRDSAQQTLHDHGDWKFQRGFTAGIGIVFREIRDELDGLREQMKSGGLSPAEQAVFAHLDELKSRIELECDRYWRGTGVDWQPIKPVVKGIIRRADESDA